MAQIWSNLFFNFIFMGDSAKNFTQVAGGLFLLAGAAFFVWFMFQPTWFKNISAQVTNQPYARTITVDGEGKITATPDIALIDLSVVSQGKTVKQVTTDGNAKMTQVVAAVKALGVDSKDVMTSSYNLYPSYNYPSDGKAPTITGYNLDQGITVKVRKLDTVDDVLDKSVLAGANQVGQLTFDIDDTSVIKKDARATAFTKAREKAQEMASAAGVNLGRVVTFSEGYAPTPVMYPNYAMDVSKSEGVASPAPSIEAGSKELTVDVSVTYEIE
jgi:uncharacterized protein